ncbi:MAG: RluA family pseudouridine synthase [Lachnospiraceae bacterium]|nr:RluA family pseudouridine synthase [Lachnospiraceae bacterium]
MKEIIVNRNEAGQRLDKLLGKYLNQAPKSFIYKMLRKKNIKLNDKKAEGNEILKEQDSIKLFLSEETIASFQNHDKKLPLADRKVELDIVYQDEDVIFVNKPAGMLSQKADANDISLNEHLLSYVIKQNILKEEELVHFRPSVCNRLDRNTSGLVLCGISLKGLQELSEALRERTVQKYYLTIVKGVVTKSGKIEGYLYKDEQKNTVIMKKEKSKDSSYVRTEYEPVSNNGTYTLLKVHLITGKTHQIRACLSLIGFPILGDSKYGDILTNQEMKKDYSLKFQLLHSYQVVFPEDFSLKTLAGKTVTAKLPIQFLKMKKGLNL